MIQPINIKVYHIPPALKTSPPVTLLSSCRNQYEILQCGWHTTRYI